jgi:hypothetical protein
MVEKIEYLDRWEQIAEAWIQDFAIRGFQWDKIFVKVTANHEDSDDPTIDNVVFEVDINGSWVEIWVFYNLRSEIFVECESLELNTDFEAIDLAKHLLKLNALWITEKAIRRDNFLSKHAATGRFVCEMTQPLMNALDLHVWTGQPESCWFDQWFPTTDYGEFEFTEEQRIYVLKKAQKAMEESGNISIDEGEDLGELIDADFKIIFESLDPFLEYVRRECVSPSMEMFGFNVVGAGNCWSAHERLVEATTDHRLWLN